MVWIASMGVLVLQHDLGTSLMFFAMFVSMLYVATGRKSWIVIGFIAFAAGAVRRQACSATSARVEAWLHPFSTAHTTRPSAGPISSSPAFSAGFRRPVRHRPRSGHPSITPFANSDYIYASLGEELGLTGLLAILLLYLLIIASGIITAMKIKDGFGKLLASGLVFTMAFQVFTVVGGITLVIPLTGLTLPYMAAGGSSLIANYMLATLLIIISNAANKPVPRRFPKGFGRVARTRAGTATEIVQSRSGAAKASHPGRAGNHAAQPGKTGDAPKCPPIEPA